MINEGLFRLTESRQLSDSVRLLRLNGDTGAITAPGQFVTAEIENRFLRRPFSVCDWDTGWLTLIVERVGSGTEWIHALPVGSELKIMTGLGNGFDFTGCSHPLLVGCGTGLSPLVGLARRMRESGIHPTVLLGFRNERERFGAEFFTDHYDKALSAAYAPSSSGFCSAAVTEGNSTPDVRYVSDLWEALRETPHDCFYGCGSESIMTELCRRETASGQVAFDVRMGCGFGACMGCSKKTRSGMKRVCKDGPVFRKEELVWDV